MHGSVMFWLADRLDAMAMMGAQVGDVLEIGSYNENGSARDLFEEIGPTSYIGIDTRAGRDVDRVMAARDIVGNWSAHFDLVICTEMLEHDPTPWLTFKAMGHVLKRGGHALVTARGFDEYAGCYGRHDCPHDYYRYNPQSFEVLFEWGGLTPVTITPDPEVPGVFGHAVK